MKRRPAAPTDSAVFRHQEHVLTSKLEDESLLLDLTSGNYFALNDTGLRIWELVDGRRSVAQIAKVIAREFDLAAADAAGCAQTFLRTLSKASLVEPV
jgi:hypothetical protein